MNLHLTPVDPGVWAGGGRPRPGWTSSGDIAESVLGTVQECEPPSCPCLARSSLPPGVWYRAQVLGEGGGLCRVWACLWECLSASLSLSVSLTLHLCACLFISLSLSIFLLSASASVRVFSICLFLSLHLSLFVFTLISLSVLPCLPASVSLSLVVGLPVSFSLSRNLVTGRGCRAGC